MKCCTLLPGVCLFAVTMMWAQSPANDAMDHLYQQRLENLARQEAADAAHHRTYSSSVLGVSDSVISLQKLAHSPNKRAFELEKKGMREFSHEHYRAAIPLLQKAATLDPDTAILHNNLGVIYCVVGEDQDALESFQRATEKDPSAVVSYTNLASVAFNNFQYGLAETAARRVLRLSPGSLRAELVLALAEVAQDKWSAEARHLLEENRLRSASANRILQSWPTPEEQKSGFRHTISVRGPGPGAFVPASPKLDASFR